MTPPGATAIAGGRGGVLPGEHLLVGDHTRPGAVQGGALNLDRSSTDILPDYLTGGMDGRPGGDLSRGVDDRPGTGVDGVLIAPVLPGCLVARDVARCADCSPPYQLPVACVGLPCKEKKKEKVCLRYKFEKC